MEVCGVDTLGQLNLPALVDTLHLHHPLSVHFSCLFPSLSSLSFNELLDLSGKFLKSNALVLPATAAISSVAADLSTAIDRTLVSRHESTASRIGLRPLLRELSQALRPFTLQPLTPDQARR